MLRNAFRNLDNRRWIDRFQPQTLAIATWLLYIQGAFSVLNWLDRSDLYGAWAHGSPKGLLAFVLAVSFVAGPFLMANGKKFGWWLSIAAAASPWLLRVLLRLEYPVFTVRWVLTQNDTIGFMFEVALMVLLLHPMSRSHEEHRLR